MSLRRTKKYEAALNFLRANGLKVRHRPMVNSDGSYDPETEIIVISTFVQGTVRGCFVAFHEYAHHMQKKKNLFPKFMRGFDKYSKKAMDEVVAAEIHASEFAVRMLKGLKIKYSPDELDPKNLESYVCFWRKYYFAD